MLSRIFFTIRIVFVVIVATMLLGIWFSAVGPQVHVGEAVMGMGIWFIAVLVLMFLTRPAKPNARQVSQRAATKDAKRSKRANPNSRLDPALPIAQPDRNKPNPELQQRDLIREAVDGLTHEERQSLAEFLTELIEIRNDKTLNKQGKAKKVFATIKNSRSLWPVIRAIYKKIKLSIWDRRGGGFRSFLAGSAVGIVFFGFQGAGIAALGGAIGLPLWIVFGGGAVLAHALLKELDRTE